MFSKIKDMQKHLFFILLLMVADCGLLSAQAKDSYLILEKVKEKFSLINDYQANVRIIVNVDFLKVPESEATVYYKKPDKINIDSEGFALLPRQGLNFSPAKILEDEYSAIYSKTDTLKGRKMDIIKVLPSSDTSDVILTTLWIDLEWDIIYKIETTTKNNGTFLIDLEYEKTQKFGLPSSALFTFNLPKMRLPMQLPGDRKSEWQEVSDKQGGLVGRVTVFYSNYKINQGLDDSFFERRKKD